MQKGPPAPPPSSSLSPHPPPTPGCLSNLNKFDGRVSDPAYLLLASKITGLSTSFMVGDGV